MKFSEDIKRKETKPACQVTILTSGVGHEKSTFILPQAAIYSSVAKKRRLAEVQLQSSKVMNASLFFFCLKKDVFSDLEFSDTKEKDDLCFFFYVTWI